MTLTEQVKILDDKIKVNKAQYELDREAAKVSVLLSGELEKYEYFTGEDLKYKPDVIQKAKFEYSTLGKVFNTGLDESDKKERLLKRLKNIEDKGEEQLKMICEKLSPKAKNIFAKLTSQERLIKYIWLNLTGGSNVPYDFRDYKSLKELFKAIYYRNLSREDEEMEQEEFEGTLTALERHNPRKSDYKTAKDSLLLNA